MSKVVPLRKVSGEAVRIAMDKPPRRRRWNRQRAWDNLLTVVGIAATGIFFAYLVLSWMRGVPW